MTKIVRDDGSWIAEPSGAVSGDLNAWRDRMYHECPAPEIGDVLIVLSGKKRIGYRALTAEGYHTRWQRVSSEELKKHLRFIDVKDGGDELTNPDDYVYLADGVYVHKDDAWF